MLTKTAMQEIQDLKLQGYTQAGIVSYYETAKPTNHCQVLRHGCASGKPGRETRKG